MCHRVIRLHAIRRVCRRDRRSDAFARLPCADSIHDVLKLVVFAQRGSVRLAQRPCRREPRPMGAWSGAGQWRRGHGAGGKRPYRLQRRRVYASWRADSGEACGQHHRRRIRPDAREHHPSASERAAGDSPLGEQPGD